MKRRALVAAAALATAGAIAAAVLGSVLGGGEAETGGPGSGGEPVVETSIAPSEHLVGDPVVARITIRVDREHAAPDSVDVIARFRPYRRVGPAEVLREDGKETTVFRYAFPLQCVDLPCVPQGEAIQVELPTAVVHYFDRDRNLAVDQHVAWPKVMVGSRVGFAEPALRAGTSDLPPASYRLGPTFLGWLFAGASAALVLTLGAAIARRLARRPAERPEEVEPLRGGRSPLERALALVEEATGRAVEERRTALDALALALEGSGFASLASPTRRLAWSAAVPEPDAMGDLAASVRRALGVA